MPVATSICNNRGMPRRQKSSLDKPIHCAPNCAAPVLLSAPMELKHGMAILGLSLQASMALLGCGPTTRVLPLTILLARRSQARQRLTAGRRRGIEPARSNEFDRKGGTIHDCSRCRDDFRFRNRFFRRCDQRKVHIYDRWRPRRGLQPGRPRWSPSTGSPRY